MLREETVRQNREAMTSEPLMSALEPKSADVNFEGVLNAPEVDEEWEAENQKLQFGWARMNTQELKIFIGKLVGKK